MTIVEETVQYYLGWIEDGLLTKDQLEKELAYRVDSVNSSCDPETIIQSGLKLSATHLDGYKVEHDIGAESIREVSTRLIALLDYLVQRCDSIEERRLAIERLRHLRQLGHPLEVRPKLRSTFDSTIRLIQNLLPLEEMRSFGLYKFLTPKNITESGIVTLYQLLLGEGFIDQECNPSSFNHLFSGQSEFPIKSPIKWLDKHRGSPKKASLFYLIDQLADQELIERPSQELSLDVIEHSFTDFNGASFTNLSQSYGQYVRRDSASTPTERLIDQIVDQIKLPD